MDALMKPSAIAVVGATNKRVTRGNLVLKNIRTADFKGKVYAVLYMNGLPHRQRVASNRH